jgi:hypothetical protein
MNTFNRPRGKRTQTPAAIVTDVKPSQERTSEDVRAIQQRRIIERGTQRIEQQRKTRLELKAKLKVQPKTALPGISSKLSSPLPKAHASKAPVLIPGILMYAIFVFFLLRPKDTAYFTPSANVPNDLRIFLADPR